MTDFPSLKESSHPYCARSEASLSAAKYGSNSRRGTVASMSLTVTSQVYSRFSGSICFQAMAFLPAICDWSSESSLAAAL